MASASVYFNESPIGLCLASVGKGAPNHDGVMVGRTETATVVCASVRVRTSVHACVMCLQYLTRFNKIAIQGIPQMAVD